MFAAESTEADIFVLGLELIGAICALGVVVWAVRRWLLSTSAWKGDGDWSLQHLREMKAQGQITEEEFEALKTKMLDASRLSFGRKDRTTSADSG